MAFNGTDWPLLRVYAAFGAAFEPSATTIRLGVGPGLGTGTLGGGEGWVDITADVQVVRRQVGRDGDTEPAQVGSCVLTVDNRSGDYDPSNADGPFWGTDRLTANQQSLEAGTTDGWVAGSATTIASSTAQAYDGARSLALTKTGSTGTLFANTPAVDLGQGPSLPVAPASPIRARARFRANTTGRPCRVRLAFYDASSTYISGGDLISSPVTDGTAGWVTAEVRGTTPADATAVALELQAASDGNGAVGEVHYADGMSVQPSGIEVGTPIQVQVEYPPGTVFPRFYGEIADIAPDDGYDPRVSFTCADGLEKLGRARLAATPFTPQFDNDTSGARIGHLADLAAWPTSLRAIDTGYAVLAPTTLGSSALELMRKAEATEVGLLYVDGAGVLVFYDRHRTTTATRSTTVQAAFTDTGGASDIEMTSLTRAKSRERTVNDWHITREPGYIELDLDGTPTGTDLPIEQVATNQPSVDTFGLLAGGQGLGPALRTDEEALNMAEGLLPRYPYPQTRIREVTVDAITQGRWAQLLPLTLLDRISASRDYGPVAVTGQLLIQALTEEIRNDETNAGWTFTFSTTNPLAVPDLFIVGTSQVGVDSLGW